MNRVTAVSMSQAKRCCSAVTISWDLELR
jgi:hypothetical protein